MIYTNFNLEDTKHCKKSSKIGGDIQKKKSMKFLCKSGTDFFIGTDFWKSGADFYPWFSNFFRWETIFQIHCSW